MNPPTKNEIEAMLQAGESATLDYKSQPYTFGGGASDKEQSRLLKDVLAMANAWKSTDAHIIIGAKENPGSRAAVVGISEHVDDSRLQQFINGKTNVPVDFAYHVVDVDGLSVGVITVAAAQKRPVWIRKSYGDVEESKVYIRRGSSTSIASPDEVAGFGEARVDQSQDEIHAILTDQRARDAERAAIDQFVSFLHNERYHDLRFPDLKSAVFPLGLVYTAYPERDEKDQPRVLKTEMTTMYVIRIEQSRFQTLSPEETAEYDGAPVHTNELYFCRYYNQSWHVGQSSVGNDWQRVYLSGKLGEVETGTTANEFRKVNVPPSGVKWETQVIIGDDGRPANAGYTVTVYLTDLGVHVQPSRKAPPKPVHCQVNVWTKSRRLVLENFEGYFTGEARKLFCDWLVATVEATGHKIPEVQVFEDA